MSRTERHTDDHTTGDRREQDHRAELERKGVPPEHAPQYSDEDLQPRRNYEEFSDEELADRAERLEIEGRETMLNDQLIEAIRRKEQPDRVDATRQADHADPDRGIEGRV